MIHQCNGQRSLEHLCCKVNKLSYRVDFTRDAYITSVVWAEWINVYYSVYMSEIPTCWTLMQHPCSILGARILCLSHEMCRVNFVFLFYQIWYAACAKCFSSPVLFYYRFCFGWFTSIVDHIDSRQYRLMCKIIVPLFCYCCYFWLLDCISYNSHMYIIYFYYYPLL